MAMGSHSERRNPSAQLKVLSNAQPSPRSAEARLHEATVAVAGALRATAALLEARRLEAALESATNLESGARDELSQSLSRLLAYAADVGIRPAAERTMRDKAERGDLATVKEFAAEVGVGQNTVFEWIKRGLPSVKTKGLGRRIQRQKATDWLIAGGPERSRAAKKLAQNGAGKAGPNGQ
jgi:excisionase family DNA binding protein